MKENKYEVRKIKNLKELLTQTVELNGDRPIFKFKYH